MTAFMEGQGLHKVFLRNGREIHALRGIDITVARGDFLAITGPSGSGKSTLLHVVGTLEVPSAGSCRVAGCDLSELDDEGRSRLRRSAIGFVFQGFHLIPQLDILENVAIALRYAGVSEAEARERASMALVNVGLGGRLDHRPAELSGGELQRAAIARAVVGRPQAVLADEPTGNLDSVTGREVLGVLEELNEAGTTLVLVTHDERIAARASRRICIRDGRRDQ